MIELRNLSKSFMTADGQVDALRNQGWQIRRVWALDWFDNRDKELRAILRELEELCAAEEAV